MHHRREREREGEKREMGSTSQVVAIMAESATTINSSDTTEIDTYYTTADDLLKEAVVAFDDSSSSPFSIGEKVLAYHTNCLYQAKVQKVQFQTRTFRYYIHYLGWKKSWDEWVGIDRLLKLTEENIKKQEELYAKHSGEIIAKPGRASLIRHINSSVARGRKRKNYSTAKDINNGELGKIFHFHVPSTLKKQLVDDCEFITHMGKLVKLPRNPNVDDILNKYLSHCSKKDGNSRVADTVAEIVSGLRSYFDKSLPIMLLYKNERKQYQEAIGNGASPATLYGAEHLLRLFVKLPEILSAANIEEDTLKELQQEIQDILKFLQINRSAFLMPSYQKLEDFESIPEVPED